MHVHRLPRPPGQGSRLVACISVARVRPRTSKGITDLLLPQSSIGYTPIVPLRSVSIRSAEPNVHYLAG